MLYVGMTNDLERRIIEHKLKLYESWATRYNLFMLLHYEEFNTAMEAINREKQVKRWARKKKIALIEKTNPNWVDLAKDWFNYRMMNRY